MIAEDEKIEIQKRATIAPKKIRGGGSMVTPYYYYTTRKAICTINLMRFTLDIEF